MSLRRKQAMMRRRVLKMRSASSALAPARGSSQMRKAQREALKELPFAIVVAQIVEPDSSTQRVFHHASANAPFITITLKMIHSISRIVSRPDWLMNIRQLKRGCFLWAPSGKEKRI